ncbi:hypothetical protein [Pseudohongiella sp.]|uniref:Lipocalin-like domain-containing protein n=1 Tax=marine sediment metagenome TaxID=412755 RepID=A0A0F9Z504_9ZZZZ|nr:hypothetical protein [Pseudohongiella sp.]HDZ09431.1 hypothetical protein [Pseudohongiella sp.]HEA63314.1 hypothetical protein [Pseudohongiella sp.]
MRAQIRVPVRAQRMVTVAAICLMTVACASNREPSKQVLIQGAWQAEFEGQAMTLEYSVAEVTVREFGISFPYEWEDDDHIRLNAMGQEVVSHVEFEGTDIMRQTTEGDTQEMRRVP